jgi:NAD(P)-dependent dehydrogenase (short-subunit alcohol dehydrogenase family)
VPLTRGEIAETIVFLAPDRVSYLNGAVIPIDGARRSDTPANGPRKAAKRVRDREIDQRT